MKQPVLVIIKPDGIYKKLVGNIIGEFARTGLEIVAVRLIQPNRKLAEEHYKNIKDQPFFKDTVSYFCGKFHKTKKLWAIVYYGENAIKKCRRVAGATNPEEAAPDTIRGAYGGINKDGIFENVVHVSSDAKEARREIKLWLDPADITMKLYSTKIVNNRKQKVWL